MKSIASLILSILLSITTYSQIAFSTYDTIDISFTPKTLITKLTYSLITFEGQQRGIQFTLKTKPGEQLAIRIDSILINSSDNKSLALNNPYKDTVYFDYDGSLQLITTHWLDNSQIDFLKKEIITSIVFPTNKQNISLNISNKSNRKLQVVVRSQF